MRQRGGARSLSLGRRLRSGPVGLAAAARVGVRNHGGLRVLVSEPMLAADDNFRPLVAMVEDVDARAPLEHDAAFPFHRVRRTAVVETGERALMRFRPARAEPGIVGKPFVSARAGATAMEVKKAITKWNLRGRGIFVVPCA